MQRTKQLVSTTFLGIGSILAMGAVGCKVSPTDPSLAQTDDGRACPGPGALLDDGEDSNNQTFVAGGRGGYWYTFMQGDGTEVWPQAGALGGTFEMSPGGADGTQWAARFKGVVGQGAIVLGGMGMNFVDPKGGYDASKYGGVEFWAKKAPGSVGKVRLKVPDVNTDPDGGVCSECFNDFGTDLIIGDEWQHYIVPFSSMKQMKGWGKPRKGSIETTALYGVQFQVSEPGATYDITVDQLRFTGCK
ncbi:MAG TPA: hypothetical protein VLC09_19210 [Polyangiaceae bacterium]|nr:hypothetical protein [Polyangiaceae bacterium]